MFSLHWGSIREPSASQPQQIELPPELNFSIILLEFANVCDTDPPAFTTLFWFGLPESLSPPDLSGEQLTRRLSASHPS